MAIGSRHNPHPPELAICSSRPGMAASGAGREEGKQAKEKKEKARHLC